MVPRGVEVLVKKAAIDEEFRTALLEQPMAAAGAIGLELGATEVALLKAVRREQLESIIAHTDVDPRIRPVLMGNTAGPMLKALNKHSLRYEVPCAVVGATVGPLDGPVGWAVLAGILGAIALPLVLLWRWIRRRAQRKE